MTHAALRATVGVRARQSAPLDKEEMQMESGTLVDAGRCAAALGVPKSTLYKMVKKNMAGVYSVGGKGRGLRFDIAEVREALRRAVKTDKGEL